MNFTGSSLQPFTFVDVPQDLSYICRWVLLSTHFIIRKTKLSEHLAIDMKRFTDSFFSSCYVSLFASVGTQDLWYTSLRSRIRMRRLSNQVKGDGFEVRPSHCLTGILWSLWYHQNSHSNLTSSLYYTYYLCYEKNVQPHFPRDSHNHIPCRKMPSSKLTNF